MRATSLLPHEIAYLPVDLLAKGEALGVISFNRLGQFTVHARHCEACGELLPALCGVDSPDCAPFWSTLPRCPRHAL